MNEYYGKFISVERPKVLLQLDLGFGIHHTRAFHLSHEDVELSDDAKLFIEVWSITNEDLYVRTEKRESGGYVAYIHPREEGYVGVSLNGLLCREGLIRGRYEALYRAGLDAIQSGEITL